MSDSVSRRTPPAEAIAAYRDALRRNVPVDELARLAVPLDPEIVAWLDLFQVSRRESMRPDPAFVRRLDHVIAKAPGPTSRQRRPDMLSTLTLTHADAINGHEPIIASRPGAPGRPNAPWLVAWPSSLSRLAAAVLIIALLAGSAFAALYPLRQRSSEGLPLFAPLGTPEAETAPVAASVLLDLTLMDIPGFRNEGGMAVTDYPPGGGSVELAGKESPEVFYVATGSLTMRVEEAVDPVRVIPPREAGPASTERLLAVRDTTTLATGTAVVLPERAVVDLRNQGSAPAKMLDLLWATESYSTESDGANWRRATGGKPQQELTFPVEIVLSQIRLEANQTIPAPSSADVSQAAAALDPDRMSILRYASEGSIRNDSEEPLDAYVLTIRSNAEVVLPAAAPRASTAETLELLWESVGGADPLSRPYGLGIDPQGNLWVSDANNDRFQILAPDGSHLETWGSPGDGDGEFEFFSPNSGFGAPYGDVAFDAAGNIYVADTGNFRVQKFAPDRSFLLAWGEEGEGDGQFLAPSSIAIGPDGTVHVSDEERADVQMFDADGQFLGVTAQAPDDGVLYMPAGIAVDGDGAIWVADYLGHRILSFSPSGEILSSWGQRGIRDGQFVSPNDVAVDAAGRVFVADDGNNRLQVFSADGEFLNKIGGIGGNNGILFGDAVGVAVSSDGIVHVTDNASIQAFRFTLPDAE